VTLAGMNEKGHVDGIGCYCWDKFIVSTGLFSKFRPENSKPGRGQGCSLRSTAIKIEKKNRP